MALDINGILDVVVAHAQSTGYFENVNEHESKQASLAGISAGVWVESISPIRSSGLANTSVRLELQMRVYGSTQSEPYDDIDANITLAVDSLFTAYLGDFTLGGEARHIDIFGAHGAPLHVNAGYLNQAGQEFRVFQMRIPIILNDIWAESP